MSASGTTVRAGFGLDLLVATMSQRLSPGAAGPTTDLIGRYDMFWRGYFEGEGE